MKSKILLRIGLLFYRICMMANMPYLLENLFKILSDRSFLYAVQLTSLAFLRAWEYHFTICNQLLQVARSPTFTLNIIYTAFKVLCIPIIFVVLRFKNFFTPPINHNQLYWYANICSERSRRSQSRSQNYRCSRASHQG